MSGPHDTDAASVRTRLHRAGPVLLALMLGLLVLAPLLDTPRVWDDLYHLAWRSGWLPTRRAAWDLFRFLDVGESVTLRDRGVVPWFVEIDVRGGMFRPLTSLSLCLDVLLFGQHTWPAHLHSLLWWAALVLSVDRLLGGAGPRARTLTLCGFSTGVWLVGPVGWIANRGVLMAGVFTLYALHLTQSWTAWRRSDAIRVGLLATAAGLCGEYSLCWAALAGSAMALSPQPRALRLRALGALLLPILGLSALGLAHGGGLSGGGYIRPLDEGPRLLHELLPRYVLHLHHLVRPFVWFVGSDRTSTPQALLLGVLVLHLGIAWLGWRSRSQPMLRGYAPGVLAAALPVLVAPPNPRLLLPASMGLWIVLGSVRGSRPVTSRLAVTAVGAMVVMSAIHTARVSLETHASHHAWASTVERSRRTLGPLEGRRLLAFVDADLEGWFRLPLAWRLTNMTPPVVTVGATFGAMPTRIERVGPRTLRVYGASLVEPGLRVLRRGARPFQVGESVLLPDARFTVEAVAGDVVTRLRVDTTLDVDAAWTLALVRGARVVRLATPSEGASCWIVPNTGTCRPRAPDPPR